MHWLQSLDINLFRFVNLTLTNPVCYLVMPFVSGNVLFYPALLLLALLLVSKGGRRGLVFVLVLIVVLAVGESFVIKPIKHALERQRPFLILSDVRCLVGKGGSGSMPSSH